MKTIVTTFFLLMILVSFASPLPPIPYENFKIDIEDRTFIYQLDSIVSSTCFTPQTRIFEFYDETGHYDDYPKDLLSDRKFYEIIIRDTIVNEIKHSPCYYNEYWRKTPRFVAPDINEIDTMCIIVTANTNPESGQFHLLLNDRHYFFIQFIEGAFVKRNERSVILRRSNWTFRPFPTWVIMYENGKMRLIEFFIDADQE